MIYQNRIKRILDLLLSGLAILALSPLLLVIAAWIKLDSKGPVLFTQKRIGKDKAPFVIFKFRTMHTGAPRDIPTHLFHDSGLYVTQAGRFLRRTSLDEFPQLFNIFIGQMSVVGPRPALWNQDDLIGERDRYGANDIRPGLTGWAQINGRDELEIDRKAELDGEYAKSVSFGMDLKCLLQTVKNVIKRKGVVEGGVAGRRNHASSGT